VAKLQELVGGTTLINEDGTASYLVSGQHLVDREVANSFANETGTTPVRSDLPLTSLKIKVASQDSRNPVLVPIVLNQVQQRASNGTPLLDANGNSLMLPGQSVLQEGKAGAYIHLIQTFVPAVQKSVDLLAAQLARKINTVVDASGDQIAPIFGFKSTTSNADPITEGPLLDSLFGSPDASYADIIEASNPQSRHYDRNVEASLMAPELDARQFIVTGTFDTSQFENMDAAASSSIESLRESFSSPLTFITSSIATTVATWKNDNRANEALQKTLNDQKSSISGVNLDEEAANLVKYQQLYNASSKLMQTGRQMFDTLLGMLSS
jgi:flagellar hook-associated protein FlgK